MIKKLIVGVLLMALGAGGVLGGLWYINEKPETFNISEAINFSKSLTTHSEDLATVSELSDQLATAQSEVSELSDQLETAQREVSTISTEYGWLVNYLRAGSIGYPDILGEDLFFNNESIGTFAPQYMNEATPIENDLTFHGNIERNAATSNVFIYGLLTYNDMQLTIEPNWQSFVENPNRGLYDYVGAILGYNFITDYAGRPSLDLSEDINQQFYDAIINNNNERFEGIIKVVFTFRNAARASLNINVDVNITNI